jgi:serine phosphatase RsbU (regulator of sigma subunit)
MRIGTKILLLMLLITIGSSAIVSWIVNHNVTSYETERADAQISHAIARYLRHLDDQHAQVSRIVRALLEAPAQRSLLQAAGDSANAGAREQLKQEVLGRDVQTELQSREGGPAFHVLLNLAHEVVVVSSADPKIAGTLASDKIHWPVDAVLTGRSRPIIQYIATPVGLFLAMGVPLRTQLDEAPDNAYFVGFRIDDNWVRQQLLAEQATTESTIAPLAAWFFMDNAIVARASSDVSDTRVTGFGADTPLRSVDHSGATTTRAADHVEFDLLGEHFLGQSFNLTADNAKTSRLVLASSLDRALLPLRRLQRQIIITALVGCVIAIIACRFIARIISRPISELVAGTRRIADGQFDRPVQIRRNDELGTLANSFNEMAQGLKERDGLREERVKIERDLALARKIQMDVLPKELPNCPGYDMAAFSHPAEQTGGDIYDLIAVALDPLKPGEPPSLVLLLADATGHGIGPALSVTQVRSMLRIGVRLRAELEDVFSQINRQLCHDLGSERFVTAFLGLLDPTAHRINYHSAGQAPLLHFHARTHHFEWLDSSMIPFGIDEEAKSEVVQGMQMEPGDLIVLLTDGFYENQNVKGELFGKERISEIILRHHHASARTLLNELVAAAREFAGSAPQLDDMTGVIIGRLP